MREPKRKNCLHEAGGRFIYINTDEKIFFNLAKFDIFCYNEEADREIFLFGRHGGEPKAVSTSTAKAERG